MGCPKLKTENWRFVSAETADKNACPFLFSSEYLDSETNLVYYNYRYYSPELGRWTKRDSIEERGGYNLYAMVGNDPVGRWDWRGLKENKCCCIEEPEKCFIMIFCQGTYFKVDKSKHVEEGTNINIPYNFDLQVRMIAMLFHKENNDISGCHLHQSVDKKHNVGDPKLRHEFHPDDYGSDMVYKKGYAPCYPEQKTRVFYDGTWFFDWTRDEFFSETPPENATIEFKARVYVEEAPSVETWWGYSAKINFPEKSFSKWRGGEQ